LDELFESFHRPGSLNFRGTLSVYQLFITYLWWLYTSLFALGGGLGCFLSCFLGSDRR